jgi:hypothetical protein
VWEMRCAAREKKDVKGRGEYWMSWSVVWHGAPLDSP